MSDLAKLLEPIRVSHKLPALGCAVILHGKLYAVAVTGVRKAGSQVPAEPGDAFHLGSDTKAMTATMLAILVAHNKLKWGTTIGQVFPELRATMRPEYRSVTVQQLLCHRGGFPTNSWPGHKSYGQIYNLPGTPTQQRLTYLQLAVMDQPASVPGSKYEYSNMGYAVAGAMAERVTGESYEELMRKYIFAPLHMSSAGWGAMGTAGKLDALRQHRVMNGVVTPVEPGKYSDNPVAIAPGGLAHCSLADWARFVMAHLEGEKDGGLVSAATFKYLHTPPYADQYAFGWGVVLRPWAAGQALTHAGSNLSNYCVVWIAPALNFAVLTATNMGGDDAALAVDQVASEVIQHYLAH